MGTNRNTYGSTPTNSTPLLHAQEKDRGLSKLKIMNKIIAYILLTPVIVGSLSFLFNLFLGNKTPRFMRLTTLSSDWDKQAPIFLGLLAIAGAYLLSNSSKN